MGVRLILIVFEDVHDRKLPDRGNVERFEERALFGSAISEKAVNDLAALLNLRGESGAGRVRDTLPDDSRSAGEMAGRIGKVHGATKALAQAIFSAEDFRHNLPQRRSQRNGIAVAAVAGHNDICAMACR